MRSGKLSRQNFQLFSDIEEKIGENGKNRGKWKKIGDKKKIIEE